MSISEACGHGSFVFLAWSFALQDMLQLRIIALLAGVSMAVFNFYHPYGRPLILPFRWNLLFIAVNSVWIGILLKNEWDSQHLNALENEIYDLSFQSTGMDVRHFTKLLRAGQMEIYKPGEYITRQGEMTSQVRIIVSGDAKILVGGKEVYQTEPGNFISELGLHAGIRFADQVSTASTVAITHAICWAWSRGSLIDLLESEPHKIGSYFQSALSADLLKKMSHNIDLGKGYSDMDYRSLLLTYLKYGRITNHDKNMFKRYRRIHNIGEEQHEAAIESLGISRDEWEAHDPAVLNKALPPESENGGAE